MIINRNKKDIISKKEINDCFLTAKLNDLDITCKIYNGNFYADSLNLFPITEKLDVFEEIFLRDENYSINHFYTKEFEANFKKNINNFKTINNVFVLGSSPADNYYSNLFYFLPRIFFNNNDNLKLLIHRNSSNKFRNLIKNICAKLNIESSMVYIDDNFYNFKNSLIPQYLDIFSANRILKRYLLPESTSENNNKIYVSREDSYYRKLLNESDLIKMLKQKGFKIINPQQYEIIEQIEIFSSANVIVGPYGSNLSNIIFCKPGTKVYEIGPIFDKKYEQNLNSRYSNLCKINNFEYYKIVSDSVNVDEHSKVAKKYVTEKFLNESVYYKNLLLKISNTNDFF